MIANTVNLTSELEDFAQTKVTHRLPYLEPGNFTLEIESVQAIKKQSDGKKALVVEFVILDSDHPVLKPGKRVSWYQGLGEQSSLPNIKTFMLAVLGISAADDEAMATFNKECISTLTDAYTKGAMNGCRVNAKGVSKKTKDGLRDYTKIVWSEFVE